MGVLHGWKLCPRCGASLNRGGEGSLECPSCGLRIYAKPSVAASTLVERDGKLLLARRAGEPEAGKWDLVGGFVGEGEEPRQAAVREAREETGLYVELDEHVFGVWTDWYGESESASWVIDIVWRARAQDGEPEPADDVAELRWFAPGELPSRDEFGFTHPALVVARWRDEHA